MARRSYGVLVVTLSLILTACTGLSGTVRDAARPPTNTPTTTVTTTPGSTPGTPGPTPMAATAITTPPPLSPVVTSPQAASWFATWTAETQATTGIWESLHGRPLRLPVVASGATCPHDTGKPVASSVGPALGAGPAYAVGFGAEGIARYGGARQEGGWFYQKVLWATRPDYRGPLLVRGKQLDGPNELRFESGANPPAELQLPSAGGGSQQDPGWRFWPSYTRVRAPGCYAWQVDGLDFTEVIIFQALP